MKSRSGDEKTVENMNQFWVEKLRKKDEKMSFHVSFVKVHRLETLFERLNVNGILRSPSTSVSG